MTPHRLITAIVTEHGIAYPPFLDHLPGYLAEKEG